jgi:uncharacterized membrane protein
MKRRLSSWIRAARTQLWPLPVLGVVIALAIGVVLPRVDRRFDGALPGWLSSWLFSGDPGAARTVLDAVSSSLITVTSLTFSLTVVTLQLASSQFSPRLLRTFASDVFVQLTLALFLATFTFSLTVLRTVRTSGDTQIEFVPRISVTLSYVLALASVVELVVFLAHLARQIRVETMLRDVHSDAMVTVDEVLGHHDPNVVRDGNDGGLTPPLHARRAFTTSSGFVVRIDERALLQHAIGSNACIILEHEVGTSLVAGSPVATFWGEPGPLREADCRRLQDDIAAAVQVNYERTADQDLAYGLRQLTDVALKALSPGINDPTTAVHALGHISALLCDLAGRDLGPKVLRDEQGRMRLLVRRPNLTQLLDAAITQPRRYGSSDPQVMARIFQLLEELAWHVPLEEHPAVCSQLDRLTATCATGDFDAVETGQLDDAAARVSAVLGTRAAARQGDANE